VKLLINIPTHIAILYPRSLFSVFSSIFKFEKFDTELLNRYLLIAFGISIDITQYLNENTQIVVYQDK
jgi:hypothetical protein